MNTLKIIQLHATNSKSCKIYHLLKMYVVKCGDRWDYNRKNYPFLLEIRLLSLKNIMGAKDSCSCSCPR